MEKYLGYDLKDFLADADFREWVLTGKSPDHPIWPALLLHMPHKEPLMTAAETLFSAWQTETPEFTDAELDRQVHRIMDSTAEERPAINWKFRVLSVAASLVCVMGAYWLLFLKKPGNQMQVTAFLAAEQLVELNNQSDTIQRFVLPDSTQVELFPDARLHFSSHLGSSLAPNPQKREVSMSGKIYFDVKKNKRLPFLIYTNSLVTRVVGTSFTISAVENKYSLEVKTGQVAVEKLNVFQNEEALVRPNQKLVLNVRRFLDRRKELEKSLNVSPAAVVETETPFEYSNSSMETVFKDLENTYGIPIRYDPQQFKDCTISVRLHDQSFFSKLNIISQTLQASYDVVNGEIVMLGGNCE